MIELPDNGRRLNFCLEPEAVHQAREMARGIATAFAPLLDACQRIERLDPERCTPDQIDLAFENLDKASDTLNTDGLKQLLALKEQYRTKPKED